MLHLICFDCIYTVTLPNNGVTSLEFCANKNHSTNDDSHTHNFSHEPSSNKYLRSKKLSSRTKAIDRNKRRKSALKLLTVFFVACD